MQEISHLHLELLLALLPGLIHELDRDFPPVGEHPAVHGPEAPLSHHVGPPESARGRVELPVAEHLHAPLPADAGGVAGPGRALFPLRRRLGRGRGRGALGEVERVQAAGDLAGDVAVVGEGGDEGEEGERGEGDDDQQGHRLLTLVLVAVQHWVRGVAETLGCGGVVRRRERSSDLRKTTRGFGLWGEVPLPALAHFFIFVCEDTNVRNSEGSHVYKQNTETFGTLFFAGQRACVLL
jgi:hypothetical protein